MRKPYNIPNFIFHNFLTLFLLIDLLYNYIDRYISKVIPLHWGNVMNLGLFCFVASSIWQEMNKTTFVWNYLLQSLPNCKINVREIFVAFKRQQTKAIIFPLTDRQSRRSSSSQSGSSSSSRCCCCSCGCIRIFETRRRNDAAPSEYSVQQNTKCSRLSHR